MSVARLAGSLIALSIAAGCHHDVARPPVATPAATLAPPLPVLRVAYREADWRRASV